MGWVKAVIALSALLTLIGILQFALGVGVGWALAVIGMVDASIGYANYRKAQRSF